MKIFSSVFISLLFLSQASLAAPTCKFRPLTGGNSGVCSDDEFTTALWNGNLNIVEAKVLTNKNYLYSCNYSPGYAGINGTSELMNPLIFAVCHTKYTAMTEMVVMLLKHMDKTELLCETPDRRMTVKDCLKEISDERIRNEVTKLLEQ